jgi:hypothetical protein
MHHESTVQTLQRAAKNGYLDATAGLNDNRNLIGYKPDERDEYRRGYNLGRAELRTKKTSCAPTETAQDPTTTNDLES